MRGIVQEKVLYNGIMDTTTAHKLNLLNQEFYSRHAESFSSTRSFPWQGWEKLHPEIMRASTVLDVACGNMRFEKFASSLKEGGQIKFFCVDTCAEFASDLPNVRFQQLDVVKLCIERADLVEALDSPICDLSVSFGFLHHIPGFEARRHLVDALLDKTAKGGAVALSFWCFMKDDRLARKALLTTELATEKLGLDLDEGDYFLDWQDDRSAFRYCHSFSDDEIHELVAGASGVCEQELEYRSDGRNGILNTYVILRKQ